MPRYEQKVNIFISFMLLTACVPVENSTNKVQVKLSAVFARMESATIFDEQGVLIDSINAGEHIIYLAPGTYYADIRDEFGNSVYDVDGRLLFAARAEGAELVLAPHAIDGVEVPLVALYVNNPEEDGIESRTQALYDGAPTGDRGRLLWEATKAVVGSANADSEDWSPTGTMYATSSYVSTDTGAWSSMLSAYSGYACCVDDSLSPCYLSYACSTVSTYECQNGSCTNNYHGGQCKAFANLVAYRSGVFHGTNWAWKSFPSYSWISSNCSNVTDNTIQAGDVLVYPNNHVLIVARVFSRTSVMVIDSNWIGSYGNGQELVGAHQMSFDGTGLGDLDNYKRLNCVYNNDCSSSCN